MGQYTDIQWSDSTINPTTGCDGCELWKARIGGPCYAGNLHETRLARSLPNLYAAHFDEVRLVPGRMAKAAAWSDLTGADRPDKPWLNGMPRIIFVGDMGDLFSEAVPFEFIHSEVIGAATSAKGQRHVWMLLTKQPQRMAEFSVWLGGHGYWPENVWAGTSITSRLTTWRIRHLLDTRARFRFLSVEPMVQDVDVGEALFVGEEGGWEWAGAVRQMVQLVIVGGESAQGSNRGRPFDINWARRIIADCRRGGACPFVKQLGARPYDSNRRISINGPDSHAVELDLHDSHGGDWSEWSRDLKVREFPVLTGATP